MSHTGTCLAINCNNSHPGGGGHRVKGEYHNLLQEMMLCDKSHFSYLKMLKETLFTATEGIKYNSFTIAFNKIVNIE